MSFNLYNSGHTNLTNLTNNVDFRVHYNELGNQFCSQYYNMYDTNFSSLSTLYHPDSCITFFNEELIGFNNYHSRMLQYGYYKVKHYSIDITVQPLGHNLLIISSSGLISFNDSIFQQRFTETIILQKFDNNQIFVINSVFKLIN